MPPINEDYRAYRPPSWVKKTVCQLLGSLSAEHVTGLSAIVLTESARIQKGRTRRVAGRKYEMKECLGFYYRRQRGAPPTVFLVVDNIVGRRPWWFWWLPLARDAAIGSVLFHEVGHHLNSTVGSLAAGDEASAEEWNRRLSRIHFRRKRWYLRPVRKPVRFVLAGVLAFLRRRSRRSHLVIS